MFRYRGKFDDDGVFHPDEEETKLKRNQIYGAKIKELPDKQQADEPQEAADNEVGKYATKLKTCGTHDYFFFFAKL